MISEQNENVLQMDSNYINPTLEKYNCILPIINDNSNAIPQQTADMLSAFNAKHDMIP